MNDNTTAKTDESLAWQEWQAAKQEEDGYVLAYRRHRRYPNNNHESVDKEPRNLVGLAFSGGGIRSATFGLGVLEALKKIDLLKEIDYLSTVSGGGYIGGWLSANCRRASEHNDKAWDNSQPLEHDWLSPKANWKTSISHLRRYSNYLSPDLSLLSADTWSIATIWLRNTLPVQLMVFFTIACLLLAPRGLFWLFKSYSHTDLWNIVTIVLLLASGVGIIINLFYLACAKNNSCKPNFRVYSQRTTQIISIIPLMLAALGYAGILWEQVKLWGLRYNPYICPVKDDKLVCVIKDPTFGFIIKSIWEDFGLLLEKNNTFILSLIIIYCALAALSFISVFNSNKINLAVKLFISALASAVATGVLIAVFSAIMLLLGDNPRLLIDNDRALSLAFVWVGPAVLCAFSIALVLLIGIQGRDASENIREWWSRFSAWLAIYAVACLVCAVAAFYGPLWAEMLYYSEPWKTLGLGTGWLATTLAGLFAGKSATSGTDSKAGSTSFKEAAIKATPFIFIAGLLILVSTLLHLLITINFIDLHLSQTVLLGYDKAQHNNHWALLANAPWYGIFFICLLCVILLSWRIDINVFSLNNFYRNRLTRCYLGATRRPEDRNPHKFTGFDDDDDLKLSELLDGQNQLSGPFHIINCALNLGGSKDLALHTRHSAVFTLTPLRCGSSYIIKKQNGTIVGSVGYAATKTYGGTDQPTLGQAISVSGAAASPNMGYHTSAPVSFLMTLFNARLGWWFPNPCMSDCKRSSPRFSLWYLLTELFGIANEKSEFLAISDGGHFENLATYELVKRRCKVIIISDGECDPKLRFEGLGSLIRMCRVDLGAVIDIDVRSIHSGSEAGWSASRYAVGTIKYDDDSEGWLLYIKASMSGDEDTSIMQYKATHPAFPHESTGDQFYGEDQFESYRNLGYHITKQLFNPVKHVRDVTKIAAQLHKLFTDAA